MIAINMPQVGQDIPTAKVVEWLKRENDSVEKGEVVVIVESEKASFEVEAEQSGVVLKILHEEGDEVEVFKPLAYLGQPGEVYEAVTQPDTPAHRPAAESKPQATGEPVDTAKPDTKRIVASPAARRLAREHGLDLAAVVGTGPGGRIVGEDVLKASATAEAPEVATREAGDKVVPFSKLRRELARRLTLSKQTIPHFYLVADVDMTDALARRKKINASGGPKISITDMVIKATSLAMLDFERMNAHVQDDRIVVKSGVNIGVAVAVEDGLLVPVIMGADRLPIEEIAAQSKQIAGDAKHGKMDANAIGTFTITSLGMFGVQMFLPVINPPESAILAVGAVEKRPAAVNDEVVVREMMTLVLACDHRAVDGAYGGRFLNRIKENLEKAAF